MWGTQALSKVCLHLACFAAVAHWGGDRSCDVRNVNGSRVCTACLPPACPLASILLHPSLGAWLPLLTLTLSLCLLPLSTPFSDSLSSSPFPQRGVTRQKWLSPVSGGTESLCPYQHPWLPFGHCCAQARGRPGALAGERGVG